MYAGVATYYFKVDKLEEAIKYWEANVLEALKNQKGFMKSILLTDEKTGKSLGIGYWNTEEDAANFESSGLFQALVEGFKDLLEKPATREQYKVSIEW